MMAPISEKVVASKIETIRDALMGIATLPLEDEQEFLENPHMAAAGESYLRRALEALFDLGRHILVKGFNTPVAEYKAIARALRENGALSSELETKLLMMAGYRNRMVHFYDEVTPDELYTILCEHSNDVATTLDALLAWIKSSPDLIDTSL